MALTNQLGRKPRARNPRVPHLSAILAGRRRMLPAVPAGVDYGAVLPATGLGMFGNNQYGDCTCAGFYHALQCWTANANPPIDTEPDAEALALYREMGWNGTDQGTGTDAGCVEQDVLQHAMLAGIPVANGSGRHRISAYIEIDPSNAADVKLAVYSAGLTYIGFNVPSYLPESPGATWDVQPGNASIAGGHCVIVVGYDDAGLNIISWGAKYRMTWAFWAEFVDEAYMLADADWVRATGLDPAGQSLVALEAQMDALRAQGQ